MFDDPEKFTMDSLNFPNGQMLESREESINIAEMLVNGYPIERTNERNAESRNGIVWDMRQWIVAARGETAEFDLEIEHFYKALRMRESILNGKTRGNYIVRLQVLHLLNDQVLYTLDQISGLIDQAMPDFSPKSKKIRDSSMPSLQLEAGTAELFRARGIEW